MELHNLQQQSLVARSSGKGESSLKDGMTDLAGSTRFAWLWILLTCIYVYSCKATFYHSHTLSLSLRVLSYRNNELLCSEESRRICRKEVSDKESVVMTYFSNHLWVNMLVFFLSLWLPLLLLVIVVLCNMFITKRKLFASNYQGVIPPGISFTKPQLFLLSVSHTYNILHGCRPVKLRAEVVLVPHNWSSKLCFLDS